MGNKRRAALLIMIRGPGMRVSYDRNKVMIIKTSNGRTFDTERDLTAAERHIVQKLFAWESLVKSLDQFRLKKEDALIKGWNNSGPVTESTALTSIIEDLEKKVIARLSKEQL
jgi:hypothetical protein